MLLSPEVRPSGPGSLPPGRRWLAAAALAVGSLVAAALLSSCSREPAPAPAVAEAGPASQASASAPAVANSPEQRPAAPPLVALTPTADAPATPTNPPPASPLVDDDARRAVDEEWLAAARLQSKGAHVSWAEGNLHVVRVMLEGTELREADLVDLTKLPHLVDVTVVTNPHIGLRPDQLGSAWLSHLTALPRLRRVLLKGLDVDDDDCRLLAQLTALEGLDLAETRVSDAGVERLVTLTRLTHLGLAGTRVSGEGLAALAKAAPGLKALDLRGLDLTTEDLAAVGRLTALEDLYLLAASPGMNYAVGVKHLAGLVNLKSVEMTRLFREAPKGKGRDDASLDDHTLDHFARRLDESRRVFGTDEVTGTLEDVLVDRYGFRRSADGEWTAIDPDTGKRVPASPPRLDRPLGSLLEHIRGYKNVTSLDLSGFLVSDDDLKLLAGHARLERLDLSGQHVTAAGLKHLQKLPLQYLNLRGCAVGDADLPLLREIPTLRDVVLSQTRVTKEGVQQLRRGTLKAVFDPDQPRPRWCDVDWRKLADAATRAK